MKDEENRLNAILSSMAEGLVAIGDDRKVILMNQAAGILLRLAPQEALGHPGRPHSRPSANGRQWDGTGRRRAVRHRARSQPRRARRDGGDGR